MTVAFLAVALLAVVFVLTSLWLAVFVVSSRSFSSDLCRVIRDDGPPEGGHHVLLAPSYPSSKLSVLKATCLCDCPSWPVVFVASRFVAVDLRGAGPRDQRLFGKQSLWLPVLVARRLRRRPCGGRQ